MENLPKYVLITPARNEAQFLEKTIQSVVAQTVRPAKWVIVSDGSTDGTAEIANGYATQHDWIEVIQMPEHRDRQFAAKVSAFNAGLAQLKGLDYHAVGALDADITFGSDYFEFLLQKLDENPRLGLVGTPFAEDGVTYDYRFASVEHVSGACQLFRRKCFEDIGGYVPLKSGGIDLVAVLSARMKGWGTRTFPERVSTHHRKQGHATRTGISAIIAAGEKDYILGADPLWQLFRAAYRIPQRPYVVGGVCLLLGYLWPALRRKTRTIPEAVMAFRRQDQRARLRIIVRRYLSLGQRHDQDGLNQRAVTGQR